MFKSKKILALAVIAVMALMMLSVSAAETVVVSMESDTGYAGEEISVDVILESNPGILAMAFDLTYNNKLELIGVNDSGMMDDMHGNDKSAVPYKCTWNNMQSVSTTGKLVTLTFKVSASAVPGEQLDVNITFNELPYNENLEFLNIENVTWNITVGCRHNDTEAVPEVAPKCNEVGYTTGVFCNTCQSYISGHQEIPATEQHVDADGEWEHNGDEHFHRCQCGEIFDNASHTGGVATCQKKAVCSICNVEYGEIDLTVHENTENRGANNPTCNTEGFTGDDYCLDCGELAVNGTPIPATQEHVDADGKWDIRDEVHYHVCVKCNSEFDVKEHRYSEATCVAKAKCLDCGHETGEVDSTNHGSQRIRNSYPPSCSETGYSGDIYCVSCDEMVSRGRVIPATGNHTGGEATCNTVAKCDVCGTLYGSVDLSNHVETTIKYSSLPSCGVDGYTGDEYCLVCDKLINEGEIIKATGLHTGGVATCVNKAVCEVCKLEYGSVDRSKHIDTELRDVVAVSCGTDGYTGDTYCKSCGMKLSSGSVIPATGAHIDVDGKWEHDENGHYHTCACGAVFDKTAHSGGNALCTKKAVCEICQVEYGTFDTSKHAETEIRNIITVSCGKDGYTGDTYCKACNVKLASGTAIPATGKHVDANGRWEYDENGHYYSCVCGAKFNRAEHSGGNATCVSKATCLVCNVAYGGFDQTKHGATELRNIIVATCGAKGYTGDTFCKSCNSKLSAGTEVAATGAHSDDNGKWEFDENGHYHTCGECEAKFDIASHEGGSAACASKAMCSVCSAEYGDTDPEKHGEQIIKNAVLATCTVVGYTGDTHCKDCDVKLADGAEIAATGVHPDENEDKLCDQCMMELTKPLSWWWLIIILLIIGGGTGAGFFIKKKFFM